jgi:hypothetical protein
MASITSVNSVYILAVPGVFAATQLQGFAADDIYGTDPVELAETMMGVDGILSAGFVKMPIRQGISLQADSLSIQYFEQWNVAQRAINDVYFANATITLTSIGRKYNCERGVLGTYPILSDAGRVLKPRRFQLTWQSITPAAI